jgi:hypothetical protein
MLFDLRGQRRYRPAAENDFFGAGKRKNIPHTKYPPSFGFKGLLFVKSEGFLS